MEQQIHQWGTKLRVLRSRVDEAGAQAKVALQNQFDELRALQESAKKHFEQVVSESTETWKDTKAGLDETWTKLSSALEMAWHRVKG
jgi:DNA phosphorothioation-dependent restriction protein DptG